MVGVRLRQGIMPRAMLRLLGAVALICAMALPTSSAHAVDALVVLTVTGPDVTANQPSFDAFDDQFLAFNDTPFEHAHALTLSDLRALPQVSITARAEEWPKPIAARGPRLADVMAQAGMPANASINLVALDGYFITLDPEARQSQDWILAIEMDGRPLDIGRRGPVWLLYDTGSNAADSEAVGQWVWSVYLIAAE